jgi:hypothetical protein
VRELLETMARKKLKDLPKSSSRTKTIGQDPLKKPLRGLPLSKSHSALAFEYNDLGRIPLMMFLLAQVE